MKIIVHIGAGKTGTSSIQQTLKSNQKVLEAQGFLYLGLILDQAPVIKYHWQKHPSGNFNRVDKERLYEEVLDILKLTIQKSQQAGIHTLIWSNESFFGLNEKLIPILSELRKEHDLEIVVYVRKHESWIRSAYVQWGIKHKTYPGPIKKFKEWYQPGKVNFYNTLKPYIDVFGDKVVVKNMAGHSDLVTSFLDQCGIATESIIIERSNESPSNEELLLRSLYNNHFKADVLPTLFDRRILRQINKNLYEENIDPTAFLQSLMPTEEDIKEVNEQVEDDRHKINQLLLASSEKEIGSDIDSKIDLKVDSDKLLMLLAKLVIRQSIEIQHLQKNLEKLKDDE